MVSEWEASRVEGSTFGYSAVKIASAPNAMNRLSPAKARPSRPALALNQPRATATTASTVHSHDTPLPVVNCMYSTHPVIGSRAIGSRRTRAVRARCRISPSVLSATNASPCMRENPTSDSPPRSTGQLTQAKAPPTRSPLLLMGSPIEVSASSAPTSRAMKNEETEMAVFHPLIQRSSFFLPRYSMATARKISASSASVSGTYSAENRDAYHSGNAANVAAPPVTTHTSLPSQTGPIVFSSRRRSCSFLAKKRLMSIPTPKSKLSRMR